MTTTATCKYEVGQAVDVQRPDFTQPGMPLVWRRATVIAVEPNRKLFDVRFRFDDGLVQAELVGPRGGNNTIRPHVSVAQAIHQWLCEEIHGALT